MVEQQCRYSRDIFAKRHSDEVLLPSHRIAPEDVFVLISLLLPELDSVHQYFGMRETKLSDAFAKALPLPHGSSDAEWLEHYDNKEYRPENWRLSREVIDGSFPTVLKAVLQVRCLTDRKVADNWRCVGCT